MLLFWLGSIIIFATTEAVQAPPPWWQTAVFYQVYTRSFKDSNGDGIGDLRGIANNAAYFKEIGVDAIWLSPINMSPMRDFGYDISNFTAIDPNYGTLEDLDYLIAQVHKLGIKILLDFVPNHTSDQHIWFQISKNPNHPLYNDYKDFYVWVDAKERLPDGSPELPNNWLAVFGGSTWEWNADRNQFYYHDFLISQPDLNYREPKVVGNMTAILNYWLDRGIDGFRVDAAKYLFEDKELRDNPLVPGTTTGQLDHIYEVDQPETFELLQYWTDVVYNRKNVDGKERPMYLEVYAPLNKTVKYYGSENRTMQMPFNFFLQFNGSQLTRPVGFKTIIDNWMNTKPSYGIANWVTGNHDNIRVSENFGHEMIDALNLISGVLPGLRCVYYGEEIGMLDTFILWDQTVDPSGRRMGPTLFTTRSRDPARTPLQWDTSTSAGFSSNPRTWLPVNPNYYWLNIQAQREAPVSHLKVFQAVSKARKDPVMLFGDYSAIVPYENTLLITRSYNGSHFALIVNMGSEIFTYTSENLFSLYAIDVNMNVVTGSVNSGYRTGTNLKQGSLSVTLKPKAAILLKSWTTTTSGSSKLLASVGSFIWCFTAWFFRR